MSAHKPAKCYGAHKHAAGCRPGRPLCKWMRAVRASRRVCLCSFLHYPHRAGYCARFGGDAVPLAILKSPSWQRENARPAV